ncbi:hypothetical protein GDO86_000237 [Hymenochirus boettgeri]|uniref:Fibroblast growth factor-binding protein 2 n=1 Tax=Hymenochirus boettgeri TaxID=247094 RepID=A0A8T2KA76_9PIPI|nr:hypothetical protein GDO86_000237 [Hymenochirus boettgeri]
MKMNILLLALVGFCVGTLAQKADNQEKIPFQTKGRHACFMSPIGQGEIQLKIECKYQGKSYACVFAGKPSYCRAFNRDQKGFWNKLSQDLMKLTNPCDTQLIKHSSCPKAPPQSQLRRVDGSPQSDTSKTVIKTPPSEKPSAKKPASTKKPVPKKLVQEPRNPVPKKLEEEPENPKAMKIAKERCWWYFQKFCSYMIEIFVS